MLQKFLWKYGLGFIIALSCLGALIYYTITTPEDFDNVFATVVAYVVVLAGNIGMIIHAAQWVKRTKAKNNHWS